MPDLRSFGATLEKVTHRPGTEEHQVIQAGHFVANLVFPKVRDHAFCGGAGGVTAWAFRSCRSADMMLGKGSESKGGIAMPDQNPFLAGSFAPVEEEITAFGLPVTGTLPPDLNGCYLRNGPNPMGLEDPGARWGDGHWFLGSGMVHGVGFHGSWMPDE
jgi:hypothetical protein